MLSYHHPPLEGIIFCKAINQNKHSRHGNGRIGRLIVNYILLRRGEPILIIPMERKSEYISCLKTFRNDSQEYLIDFFYRVACERMESELSEKTKSSKKLLFLF